MVKFSQKGLDLLIWDGQEVKMQKIGELMMPDDKLRTLPEWKEHWAEKGGRIATMYDIYSAIHHDNIRHADKGKNIVTGTEIQFTNDCKNLFIIPDDLYHYAVPPIASRSIPLKELIDEDYSIRNALAEPRTPLTEICGRFAQYFEEDKAKKKIQVVFCPFEKRAAHRCVALIDDNGSPIISLTHFLTQKASSYGIRGVE